MSSERRISPVVRFPPPLMFVLVFLAAIGLQHVVPLPTSNAPHRLGFVLVVAGVAIALSCVFLFLRTRTTIVPHRTASTLVSVGPYRLTRNPMYVSLTLAYLGVASIRGELWPLVLLPIPLAVLQRVVIPFEEARMREAFRGDFDAYCQRVRRWL